MLRGFRVLEPLGQGGMGKVYLARDEQLDRLVALKFMTAPASATSARARFMAEARALARLDHPNVVGVFRVDETPDGHPFIAYEYVRGESLDRVLLPVRWQTALAVVTMIARALRAAHAAKLLHRDVKPSNIVITPDGEAKLLDFGLVSTVGAAPSATPRTALRAGLAELDSGVRLTAPGLVVGTPRYWAPEQWRGERATAASDVYALGVVAYELLTGRLPYAERVGADLVHAMREAEVDPLDPSLAPAPLLDVIMRCLRREPSERYPSGVDVARALDPVEAVFLPRGRAEARIGSDEDLVAASWARVTTAAGSERAIAERAYAHLFAALPEVRALLPADLSVQEAKVMHTLDLTVRGLHDPESLAPMLRELGRRHVGYHVEPAQLVAFGRALRRALSELDPQWSESIDFAWEHAYAFIAASMRAGMEAAFARGVAAASPSSSPPPLELATPPASRSVEPPRTAYARVGEASVAYHLFGHGPPDLLLLAGALTHVEATWAHPAPVTLLAGLARFARVALFDKRGSGLSDPLEGPPTVEAVVEDALAVMSAAKMDRAIVVAAGEAALPAIRFAATEPARVEGLVLIGAEPRMSLAPDYPSGRPAELWEAIERWVGEHWGEPILAELLAPAACRDPSFEAWFASYFRLASSPRRAAAIMHCMRDADERPMLPRITAPTLVLRRKGDIAVAEAQSRDLAAAIGGARYVEVPGDDHFLFAGDGAVLAAEIERFAASLRRTEAAAS